MTTTAKVAASGLVLASAAASVAQRTAPTSNFISELGVRGRRLGRTFRMSEAFAGLACLRLATSSLRRPPATVAQRVRHQPHSSQGALLQRLLGAAVARTGGELRGAALGAAGACLLATATVPSSPGCPLPLLDGRAPRRDWLHVPAAITAFQLLPVAAGGSLRRLLMFNLAVLGPPTLLAPHGPVTAVLQRSMTLLGAVALATWSPSSEETRRVNLARWSY